MVERLAHRELRNRSAEVLRDVAAGATYEVTNHGEVVAILMPAADRVTVRIRPATKQGAFKDLPRVRLDHAVQDSLDDLRGER